MVNLKTYASSAGGGDTSGLVPYTGGTTNITIAHSIEIDSDSEKLYLGDGQDASIYYDGTDLIINSREVGTGVVKINGGFAFNDVVSLVTSATPPIANGNVFIMGGGALPRGTSVTNFTNAEEGQMITFRATNATITIVNGISIQLKGSVNFAMGTGDNITLVKFATKWEEISRTEM